MAWRTPWWVFIATVVVLGSPAEVDACQCGATAQGLGPTDLRPANGLVALTHCSVDLPISEIAVTVDGEARQLVSADVETGEYGALYRIEPPPQEGQAIALEVCGGEELGCPIFASSSSEWIASAEDHDPPEASARGVSIETHFDPDDGISCPPYGSSFLLTVEDPSFDQGVAALRAEVLRDGVVVDGRLGVLPSDGWGSGEPLIFPVYADTSPDACLRVFALDAAGNSTALGQEVCYLSPGLSDDSTGASDPGEMSNDPGCGCSLDVGRRPTALGALCLLAVAGIRRRARRS